MTELVGVGAIVSVSTVVAETLDEASEVDKAFVLLTLLLPIPARETRFASNSTNTTLGLISLTIFPANSADDDEMCAVPRM
jgi:hypothetical protein